MKTKEQPMYDSPTTLAFTGGGTAILGTAVDPLWFVATGVAAIALGVVAIVRARAKANSPV